MFIVLGVVFLNLGAAPPYGSLPNLTYWDSTIPVRAYNTRNIEMGFVPQSSIILGKITIYSDSPIINASLMDSSGQPIFNHIRVDESYRFTLQSTKNDFYYLYFDNSQSPQDKIVLWQVYYYANFPIIFFFVGTILLIVAGASFLVFFRAIKKKV